MAGDQRHAVGGHLVGHGNGLFRIAGVVADIEIDLLAEHAAGGVDVVDRHLAAIGHLCAEGGVLARDRADDGDRYGVALLAAVAATGHRHGHGKGCHQPGKTLHRYLPLQGPASLNSTSFAGVERRQPMIRRAGRAN